MKNILTIAGSDPSGGAGVQADLATFQYLGARGFSAITALTAQNEDRFFSLNSIGTTLIREQIRSITERYPLAAIKIGLLGTEQTVLSIGRFLETSPAPVVVLDPVIRSSTGSLLTDPRGVACLREVFLPKVTVVTPNIDEAETLSRMQIQSIDDMRAAAEQIFRIGRGIKGVYIKGGHLETDEPTDVLFDGTSWKLYASKIRYPKKVHGTGCIFSSALTVFLAEGMPLPEAAARAKEYVTDWIASHQS